MGADVTIYCLEKLTDYSQFERLCNDLMALEGYSAIEPLGGFKDRGRDAIQVDKSKKTTIFAYSVRENWRAKLAEDASKIRKHGHSCDELVFICTASFTNGERDEALASIQNEFGWHVELYGLERLRILLATKYPEIKRNHPQIFPPAMFITQRVDYQVEGNDYVLISAAPEDSIFAEWLTRKLIAEGYLVWYERLSLPGVEPFPDEIDEAIKKRVFTVVALYSQVSLRNPELMRQRSLALSITNERKTDFIIPINVDSVAQSQLDRLSSSLVFVTCHEGWASVLVALVKRLVSSKCPKPLYDGKALAAQYPDERDVLLNETESLISNCLKIKTLPQTILCFRAGRNIPEIELYKMKSEWAYRQVTPMVFLSFCRPPSALLDEYELKLISTTPWERVHKINGIWSRNLVSELIRKSLITKCYEKGLHYCQDTKLHYFPWGLPEGRYLNLIRPGGSPSHIKSHGERKFWSPSGSKKYRYYLAPVFAVTQDLLRDFTVLLYIRIRLSDLEGNSLNRRSTISRRKHLCKNWWNKQWLDRLLAVCQYLSDDNEIAVGQEQTEKLVVNAIPLSIQAPIGINESALERSAFNRSEINIIEEDYELRLSGPEDD